MKILLLAFFCYYFLTIICCLANQCGHQNGGKICPNKECCSHEGFCGTDEAHCTDCQSNCDDHPNPVPECGRQNGGKFCHDGICCSMHGFCGHAESYCGRGCQSNCTDPGNCTVDPYMCGVQNGGRICPEGFCCDSYGYCGTGQNYCGPGCQNNCPNNSTNPVPECGWLANYTTCPGDKCCSQYGFCGDTVSYCSLDCFCDSNCWPLPPPPPTPSLTPGAGGDGVSSIITKELFEEMLSRRNDDPNCAVGFYNYEAFIEAADFFEGFGTTGDPDTRKRELAAFFGQTSHETTGGAPTDYTWGYCFKKELYPKSDHCVNSTEWPCAPGKKYYGRGPMQLSYNVNYGVCGKAINYDDLLNDPDKAENDVVTSFKTAIWFWMTPQRPKPSCHDVMIGQWTPSDCDKPAGRVPGYGVITNIINGEAECGKGPSVYVENRIGYYKRYCDMLGVSYGDNLDCYNQKNFNLCSKTINGGVAVI